MSAVAAQSSTINVQFAPTVDEDIRQRLTPLLQQGGIQLDELAGVYLEANLEPVRQGQIDGMQKRVTVAYDFLLNLRIGGSQEVVSSQVISVQATGTNEATARRAALSSLRSGSAKVNHFVAALRTDYDRAFNANCARLLAKAEQMTERKELLTALAIANAVPPSSSCYAQARADRESYYLAYQAANCAEHLSSARAHLVMEVPKAAVEELAKIDPASTCAEEAKQILEEAAAQLKDQQNKKALFLRQVYQNQVQVEQARNTIISDLIKE
jgi:hypothetical protein